MSDSRSMMSAVLARDVSGGVVSVENNMKTTMFVKKRNGEREEISFDKVIRRIQNLANDVGIYPFRKLHVNPIAIAQYVCSGIYDGVTTQELDILAAD